MQFIENIIQSEFIQSYLNYVYNLSPGEIRILVTVTAIILLIMAYRWFGLIVVFALLVTYLIIYILFINNSFEIFNQQEKMRDEHMREIQKEIDISEMKDKPAGIEEEISAPPKSSLNEL